MTSILLTVAAVCLVAVSAVAGMKGGADVSLATTALSVDTIKCVGQRYLNIRITNSTGDFSQAGLDTLLHAQNNVAQVDCSVDICPKQKADVSKTIEGILRKLKSSNNVLDKIKYVYMNVLANDKEDCWYTSAEDVHKNIAALQVGMSVIRGQNKNFGVKTDERNWIILTNNWQNISAAGGQLYWVSEGSATFDDFPSFGGWTNQPALRQYQTAVSKCDTQVNLNVGRDDYLCSMNREPCTFLDTGCCQGDTPKYRWCNTSHKCDQYNN